MNFNKAIKIQWEQLSPTTVLSGKWTRSYTNKFIFNNLLENNCLFTCFKSYFLNALIFLPLFFSHPHKPTHTRINYANTILNNIRFQNLEKKNRSHIWQFKFPNIIKNVTRKK